MAEFQCCRLTPDPGPWTAGVDDSADPQMTARMHGILDKMSYDTPLHDFIWCLKAAVNVDSRTKLGWRLQVCLLWNAAHRLEILGERIDPDAIWRGGGWARIKDALAVYQGRAVAIYTKGESDV